MKYFPLITFLPLFFFTSCSDSPEKLVEDQISYMEELTEIIDDIAEGELSSADGAKKIKKWGEKGDELQERIKKLRKGEHSTEDLMAAAEKHKDRNKKAMKTYFAALQKLQESGRMTKEVQDAMLNVKN